MQKSISVIIVSHNSAPVLGRCLQSLARQTVALASTVVVDSGSDDRAYLHELKSRYTFSLIETENVGFSRANNLGYAHIAENAEYVLFLNPDAFLLPNSLQLALNAMQAQPKAAIVSGLLAGYDLDLESPTGRIDSTGIFRRWYGRWYDRDQGGEVAGHQRVAQFIPAACGAFLFCRRDVLDGFSPNVFDPDFFLYKEDIELSFRIKKAGWMIFFNPELIVFHCRGWQVRRRDVAYPLRLAAAESELVLYRKHPSPYMLWALCKYLLVRYCNW